MAGRTLDPATLRPAARSVVPAGGATVPLRPGMRPMVDVTVNGQGPFHFIVETTGGALELSPAARDRLGLRARTTGTHLPVVDVDSIRVGGALLAGLTAVSADGVLGGEVDGILGLSALANLLVTVDVGAGTFTLAEGSLPAPNGRDLLPLVPLDGYWGAGRLWGVEIDAGGTKAAAVLNLLSPGAVGTTPQLASAASFSSPPVASGRVMGPMIGRVERRVGRLGGDLRIGGYTLQRPLVSVFPVPPQLPPSWSLGAGVLRSFAVTWDQRGRVVRLARADASPIPAPPPVRDFGFDAGGGPGGGAYTVRFVIPGSAAERAAIREGDELLLADGKAPASLDAPAWRALAARTDAVAFRFRSANGGGEKDVALAPSVIVP